MFSALLLNEACFVLDDRAIMIGILLSVTLYGICNIRALVESVFLSPVNLLPDYALRQTCMLTRCVLGDPWLVVRCVLSWFANWCLCEEASQCFLVPAKLN